jgi:hypothetical protein
VSGICGRPASWRECALCGEYKAPARFFVHRPQLVCWGCVRERVLGALEQIEVAKKTVERPTTPHRFANPRLRVR